MLGVTDQANNMVMGAGSGSECTAAIPEKQDSTECSMHCPGQLEFVSAMTSSLHYALNQRIIKLTMICESFPSYSQVDIRERLWLVVAKVGGVCADGLPGAVASIGGNAGRGVRRSRHVLPHLGGHG